MHEIISKSSGKGVRKGEREGKEEMSNNAFKFGEKLDGRVPVNLLFEKKLQREID